MTAGDGADLNIAVPQVQKQSGKSDCECFAIAWAVHLAYGDKPETIILDQTQLRSHLEACLLKQQFEISQCMLSFSLETVYPHILFPHLTDGEKE